MSLRLPIPLAQATLPEPTQPPFNWALWQPETHELIRAALLASVTLLVGVILFVLLRRWLLKLRLTAAYIVANLAIAFYASAWVLKPSRLIDQHDPLTFWITRLFAAAMVFVLLRALDRLLIVPIMTRGGKVTLPRLVHQIVNIVLAVFSILIFGSIAFGWDINAFLAGSAVVSIVLGLALQETLGNFFSGLVMSASPPFAVGDWIIVGSHEGRVIDMTWRAVTLQTNEDNFVVIPNGTVATSEITNFYAPTIATARYVKVGLDYDIPPAEAIAVIKAAALEPARVCKSPEPYVFLDDFADSSINYIVKFYIDCPPDEKEAESDVRIHLWYRLKQHGYNIPFPIRTVEHARASEKSRERSAAAILSRLRCIENVHLLAPLSLDQKTRLAEIASDAFLGPTQTLFRQGDPGDSCYVISKGKVEILVTPPPPPTPPNGIGAPDPPKERQVAILGPGDLFGEMSALTGMPRNATVRALTGITLVKIEKDDLLQIFRAEPALMEKISAIVAKRAAEREAILQGAADAPAPEAITRQQKSLLGRMISFFRLGNAPA